MRSLHVFISFTLAHAAFFRDSLLLHLDEKSTSGFISRAPRSHPTSPSKYSATVVHEVKRDRDRDDSPSSESDTEDSETSKGEHAPAGTMENIKDSERDRDVSPNSEPDTEDSETSEGEHAPAGTMENVKDSETSDGENAPGSKKEVGHHGEERETEHKEGKEGHDSESFGLACFLMGGVAALMMVFYLVHMKTVKGATWKVLNMTTSIFVAVLIYGTIKSMLLEFFEPGHHGEIALILTLFVLCFVATHWLIHKLRIRSTEDSDTAEGVAILAAHITGFAAMYGFADSVELPFIEEMGGWGIILTIIVAKITMVAMIVLMDFVMTRIARMDSSVDHAAEAEWVDLCRETDNDIFCLAMSFLINLYIRYLIRGKVKPYEPGNTGNVTQTDANYLFLVACGFVGLIILGTLVRLRIGNLFVTDYSRHPYSHRVLDVIQHCNFMGCAWCFLFWGEWQLYVLGWDSTVIGGCLVVAVCLSLGSFGVVLAIYSFLIDKIPEGLGIKRALKSFELSLGILVGFSWERAFDVGFEEVELKFESMSETRGYARVLFYLLNVLLFIVVAPAWRLFIFPKAQEYEELDKEEEKAKAKADEVRRWNTAGMKESVPLEVGGATAKDCGSSVVLSRSGIPDVKTGVILAARIHRDAPVFRVEDMPAEHRKKFTDVPEVGVALKIISISKIDMANDTFDAAFNINVAWKGTKEDRPKMQLYNASAGVESEAADTKSGSEGWDWFYRVKVQGTFRQVLDLHRFPFDHQQLHIIVRFKAKCTLAHLPWSVSGEACACDPRCSMPDFILTDFQVKNRYMPSYKFTKLEGYDCEASLMFIVGRKSLYWVLNYGLVSSLVASLMACTFGIPAEMVGERMGVATTLVLTMIATKFLMMERMPSVAYFTVLDYHMLITQFFLCLMSFLIGLTGFIGVHRIKAIERTFVPIVGIAFALYHVIVIVLILRWSRGFLYSRM